MGFIVDCKAVKANYWNRSHSMMAYFDDIKNYPILTSSEERELLDKVKNGTFREKRKARNILVTHNQRFVASVARSFTNGDNLLDLINEANIGLLTAIDKFDLSHKGRFITYAVFWMRKCINEYIVGKERAIQPVNAYKVYSYASRGREKFFNINKRYPSDEELLCFLKDEYGVNISNKDDLKQLHIRSIDAPILKESDNEDYEKIGDFAIQTSSNNTNDDMDMNDNRNLIKFLLDKLPERNQDIIRSFYGIGTDEENADSIGRRLGIGKERVRQILNESLKKLRNINIKGF